MVLVKTFVNTPLIRLFFRQVDAMSGDLCERKKLSLGSKPLALRTFAANGASHVFAASDRPTVIYASNRKLLFSNLNENDVRGVENPAVPAANGLLL